MRTGALWVVSVCLAAAEWDRFRGPNGSGISESGPLPAEFGPERNLLWKTPLPPGHSSPVLSRGRLYLTAVENDALFTYCLASDTGSILWRKETPRPRREKLHKLNNPASPTPATDGDNVFVFFPDFGLLSYARDGRENWRLPLGPFNNVYGIGVSPILAGQNVVLVIDQSKDSFIVAVGAGDGRIKWRKPRPEALSGSSTPVTYRPARGPTLILAPSSFRMDAYPADGGETEWWVKGLPSEMKSLPVLGDGMVFLSGYNTPENDPGKQVKLPSWEELLAANDADRDGTIQKEETDQRVRNYWLFIDLDANGRIDAPEWRLHAAAMAAENGLYAYRIGSRGHATGSLAWKYQRSVPQLPSVLLYRDVLYMISDRGVLTTLDPATGTPFRQERLRSVSDNYYASPVASDGKIFFAAASGTIAVLEAGPQQKLLAANNLGEDIFATPAIADGRLYVRTASALYCFGAVAKHTR